MRLSLGAAGGLVVLRGGWIGGTGGDISRHAWVFLWDLLINCSTSGAFPFRHIPDSATSTSTGHCDRPESFLPKKNTCIGIGSLTYWRKRPASLKMADLGEMTSSKMALNAQRKRKKSEVCESIRRQLLAQSRHETVAMPAFAQELQTHFNRLPTRWVH